MKDRGVLQQLLKVFQNLHPLMLRECKARLHVQSCLVGFPSVCYLNYIAFQRLGANRVYQINQLAEIAEMVEKCRSGLQNTQNKQPFQPRHVCVWEEVMYILSCFNFFKFPKHMSQTKKAVIYQTARL